MLFSGFPGLLRDEQGMDLFWTPYSALTVASVVKPDRIMVKFEREFLIDPLNRGVPPANLWLGGMSGCPLFALWDTPLVHLQLAGVGIEFNENLEIMRFCPSSLIGRDGSIVAPQSAA